MFFYVFLKKTSKKSLIDEEGGDTENKEKNLSPRAPGEGIARPHPGVCSDRRAQKKSSV